MPRKPNANALSRALVSIHMRRVTQINALEDRYHHQRRAIDEQYHQRIAEARAKYGVPGQMPGGCQ